MIKKLRHIFAPLILLYHYGMAFLGALLYGFPSRQLKVIGVTGTKGKSTVTELITAILEEQGYSTALAGTIRFKVGNVSSPNLFKMTMPGRFFLQRFLRKAVRRGCSHVVLEMTSEGARQYRHAFISLDALVFTNLSPEHIESHGSYEKYVQAKLSLVASLMAKKGALVLNRDEKESERFAKLAPGDVLWYSAQDAKIQEATPKGSIFLWEGESLRLHIPGAFNVSNALAAAVLVMYEGINPKIIKNALDGVKEIPGRVQLIQETPFSVIVDYAHTADSLDKLYQAFAQQRKICVLGSTGGGRDSWKRKLMGEVADKHCDRVILTNEDPYDEDPSAIVSQVAEGVSSSKLEVIMDRRKAISQAFSHAKPGDCVLITGKGTDPFIMGPSGSKEPWDDASVAREELL
ncbi:MAG: UDP-N-acetylmuramoyl-L-alanyl-D-glutamate--2,6-diaminopimelate ligase [bacterium]|nr:UDP-N-acetylmuramoyl-L-alanyl-D-glutamate--2,6-diaminopimelate ligase [bacterium]